MSPRSFEPDPGGKDPAAAFGGRMRGFMWVISCTTSIVSLVLAVAVVLMSMLAPAGDSRRRAPEQRPSDR